MKNINLITYFKLHFIELKFNLFLFFFSNIFIFLICSYYSDQIIYLFIKPLFILNKLKYFIYTEITEFFFLNFYLSILISIYIYIPFLFIQIWFFFFKGLIKNENKKILYFFILFNFFIHLFSYIIFLKIIPNLWIYFYNINFNNNYIFNIYLEPRLYSYFLFIFTFYIYIFFIYIYIFIIISLFNIKNFINFRKIFYLKFIILNILIMPSEIYNQIFIILLNIFLFELFIFIFIINKKYTNK